MRSTRWDRIPRNTELAGGFRWRMGKLVDGYWGITAAVATTAMFFFALQHVDAVGRIPIVIIVGAVTSLLVLLLAAAAALLFYFVSGTLEPFHYITRMLPCGPQAFKCLIGLAASIIIVWSLAWKLRIRGGIKFSSALVRTSVYVAIGATIGTVVSLVLHR